MRYRKGAALLGALALMTLSAACTSSTGGSTSVTTPAGPTGGDGLVGPAWALSSAAVDSIDLTAFGITIAFTDTDVSGSSGVNTYAGAFTSSPEGAMDFGPLATTRMAGPDDAMKAETVYLAVLDTVTGYSVSQTELDLFAGQNEVLTYSRS
ncbi:MAG: META domain-containing protein [Actinobacteria bacterium]|nr:META domain-containing protein [Actinomycetota bacterium]